LQELYGSLDLIFHVWVQREPPLYQLCFSCLILQNVNSNASFFEMQASLTFAVNAFFNTRPAKRLAAGGFSFEATSADNI
jgi:hypothetical protein